MADTPEDDPAVTVPCPDCLAPAGHPCDIANPQTPGSHAGRKDRLRHRAIAATETQGTCALCGRLLLQVTDPETGAWVDTWHPAPVTAHGPPCPVEPSTYPYDARGWAAFIAADLQTNRPGQDAFMLPEETPDAEGG